MPLLNQYAGHHKLDQTLFSRGVDFTNATLFAPLWHPRSKVSPFTSFDKNSNTITVTGATWSWPYGYSFDVDDYLLIGGLDTFAFVQNSLIFSIEFVVKFNVPTTRQITMSNTDTSFEKGFYVIFENGVGKGTKAIELAAARGNGVVIEGRSNDNSITDSGYHHVIITSSAAGDNLLFYIDSILKTTTYTVNYTSLSSGDSTRTLAIGIDRSDLVSLPLGGVIGEIRIDNIAWPQAKVTQHYLAAKRRMPWANLP